MSKVEGVAIAQHDPAKAGVKEKPEDCALDDRARSGRQRQQVAPSICECTTQPADDGALQRHEVAACGQQRAQQDQVKRSDNGADAADCGDHNLN